MKKKLKQPSVQDILEELYSKKLFLLIALFSGLIIAVSLNTYKKNGPYIMKLSLKDQYFPIKDDLKHNLKYNIFNTFKDKDDLLKNVENIGLKEKINQGNIFFEIENQNKVIGTKNVNIISIHVMAKLENDENYNDYKLLVLQLIKKIKSNVQEKIADAYKEEYLINETFIEKIKNSLNTELLIQPKLEENNQNFVKIKDLLIKQNEIERDIIILESDKFEHLKIYPINPSFGENKLSVKNFISIIAIFALGGVMLVTLNRFV